MLAPLTNTQSHPDGVLSDDEFNWLTLRAEGGFGLTMTCAAHVQAVGQGFPGQLGAFDDKHLEGLTRLAAAIKAHGSVSSLQIHHAGNRSPKELVGTPVCPSDDPKTGARGAHPRRSRSSCATPTSPPPSAPRRPASMASRSTAPTATSSRNSSPPRSTTATDRYGG